MKQNDASAQGKAQTGAALGSGSGFVNHIEGFRDFVQILGRDAFAVVLNGYGVAVLRPPVSQKCYSSILSQGFSGVIQKG